MNFGTVALVRVERFIIPFIWRAKIPRLKELPCKITFSRKSEEIV